MQSLLFTKAQEQTRVSVSGRSQTRSQKEGPQAQITVLFSDLVPVTLSLVCERRRVGKMVSKAGLWAGGHSVLSQLGCCGENGGVPGTGGGPVKFC